MADQPLDSSPLRAAVPTLEPDEAFLARLSSLAAASTPVRESAAAPRTAWRVGLAAASVAAVLVGAAWLTGLGPSNGPDPSPAPTTPASSPASPDSTQAASPTERPRPTATSGPPSAPAGTGPAGPVPSAGAPDQPGGAGEGHHQNQNQNQGNGPDEHAGDHPNEHATEKAGNANQHAHDHPVRKTGGRRPR
jgi:hypothetical protein